VSLVDATPAGARAAERLTRAWQVLATVLDPEIPALSICDLGIVRTVELLGDDPQGLLEVVLTPTYSGCPATESIEDNVRQAIEAAGLGPVRVRTRRAPAWTTDWITPQGRAKLQAYGIAPPAGAGPAGGSAVVQVFGRRTPAPPVACPRCGSLETTQLSAYGSTACKSLFRCLACQEPFEYFKPL